MWKTYHTASSPSFQTPKRLTHQDSCTCARQYLAPSHRPKIENIRHKSPKRQEHLIDFEFKMAELGGVTELQVLEAEIALLERKAEMAKGAEKTSVSCSRIVGSINSSQGKDGFLATEGSGPNQFHTAAAAGDGGCCTIS